VQDTRAICGARRWPIAWSALTLLLFIVAPIAAFGDEPVWRYNTRPGDNIWDLSRRYLADWRRWPEIVSRNAIADPQAIPIGTRIVFPLAWLRLEPVAAELLDLEGWAVLRRDGAELPATTGMRLAIGDVLETGAGASAVIGFADGSRVKLRAAASLAFDRLSAYRGTGMVDTRLRLERGRLETEVQPARGSGSRFEVWTPPATSSVRGTDLRIGLDDGAERSATEVLSGTVAVAALSTVRSVGAGFGTVTQRGSAPPPPRPLLAPPDIARLPDRLERLPLRLPMPPLAGAERFRLGLAEDDRFERLVAELVVEAAAAARLDLPDGRYVARLRGIEADGLEGRDRLWQLVVHARPEPPATLTPQREGRLRERRPSFAWSEPQEAGGYDLEIAADAGFADPLIQREGLTGGNFVPPDDLPLGAYVWRIRTVDSAQRRGPWGDVQSFEILAPPADPEISGVDSDGGRLTIRLADLEAGQRIRFQIARHSEFDDTLFEAVASEAELVVPGLQPGDYWFRAQVIEADGYTAAFGTPQRITVPAASWWPALLLPFALLILLL